MSTMAFREGTVVKIGRRTYTLLRKVEDSIWQLEDSSTKRILEHTDEELRSCYVSGQLTFVVQTQGAAAMAAENTLLATEADTEIAKARRLYVKAVLDIPNTEPAMRPACAFRRS